MQKWDPEPLQVSLGTGRVFASGGEKKAPNLEVLHFQSNGKNLVANLSSCRQK